MPELVFLSERRPLLGKVAQWVAASAPGEPLDLRSTAVIVSTAGASRRLKGELVRAASDRRTGLLPPLLASPMAFLDHAGPESASRANRLLAWCEVVGRARPEEFPKLLEGFADHARPAVALKIAQSLAEVCTLLSEAGWTLASPEVASRAQDEERWRELAELYRRMSSTWRKQPRQTLCSSSRHKLIQGDGTAGLTLLNSGLGGRTGTGCVTIRSRRSPARRRLVPG